MDGEMFDAIVVGAGVEGSATAYNLSRRGLRVVLLEQFALPHSRGSSHGQSRITRKAYLQPYYPPIMDYATKEWEALQQAYGQVIFKKIGMMTIGEMDSTSVQNTIAGLKTNNNAHEILPPAAFKARFPNLRYGENHGAVVDPEGGLLIAEKCLKAFQTLFIKQGGQIRDGEPVLKVTPGDTVRVMTTNHSYCAKSLVLCCGPWTNTLLGSLHLSLPLQPIRISVCYWPEKIPGTYSAENLPAFLESRVDGPRGVYGLPSGEYPGNLKLCLHHGPEIDVDKRDAVDSQWCVDAARDYVGKHFPGCHAQPSVVESCIYTMTPDGQPILDHHPMWKNIVIGAGFSGHGFKLAPAVGHILSDFVMHRQHDFDVRHFRMDRFPQTKVIKSSL